MPDPDRIVPSLTSTRGYAASRRGQLHFVEAGSGPVLVMVPHAGRSGRMFANVIPLLAQNFRVIVFDVPGTGLSVSPPPGDISIADLADCLMDGLDDLNVDRFSIFGLHGGNKVGASMVAR
ncbi:MAG: putative alpha/beta hydrolase, partial [Ramlibacter sp.]|nr:putative alpha/beta hydrolase [Ramlibacter sp.]